MADRFFTSEPLSVGEFTLDGPEAHHLARVRRFQVGEQIALFNGDGNEYPAEILGVEKKHVLLRVLGVESPRRELGCALHIAAAMPKGDRADFLIEKLTELGVTDFTPLVTERSIVQPKASIVEKLKRAVIEASKQCGRNMLMRVHLPSALEAWLATPDLPKRKWIADPSGSPREIGKTETRDLAAAIGPEGGFTDEELTAARQAGFTAVSFGARILRIETAALFIAASVQV